MEDERCWRRVGECGCYVGFPKNGLMRSQSVVTSHFDANLIGMLPSEARVIRVPPRIPYKTSCAPTFLHLFFFFFSSNINRIHQDSSTNVSILSTTLLNSHFQLSHNTKSQCLPKLHPRLPPLAARPQLARHLLRRRKLARRPPLLQVTRRSAPRLARRPTLPTSTRVSFSRNLASIASY